MAAAYLEARTRPADCHGFAENRIPRADRVPLGDSAAPRHHEGMDLRLLPLLPFLLLPVACSGGDAEPAEGEGDGGETAAVEDTGVATEDGGKAYGASLVVSDVTPIADILADPETYVGQDLKVQGTVVKVCAKRGCWIEIGAGEGEKIRFKVEDGEMVFPMSARGSQVVAEGTWTKTVIPLEELREIRRGQAEAAGEEFDPESVTEAYIGWQLKGHGARVSA